MVNFEDLILCVEICKSLPFVSVFETFAGTPIMHTTQSVVDAVRKNLKSGRKPERLWVDRGSEFYNSKMEYFLEKESIKMNSKILVTERFVMTLKDKLYKHITTTSKNAYIHDLPEIVEQYNNTYHRTIR